MKEHLLIINLEDNRNDAELIEESLSSEGIAYNILRVETPADFLSAIAEEGVDLILADYALPGFDGLTALALARERCPDVPFIFVTGTMGEEIAIEALKHGATDYVLKQNLARLAPVVRRALQETEDHRERRQAEEALRLAEQRLALAQKSAGAGIWDWDMLSGCLDWSPELFELFGLDSTKDTASFDMWYRVVHSDDAANASNKIDQAIKDHTLLINEYRVVLPDDHIRWINALGRTTYDQTGQPIRMAGICLDITERKYNEERLKTLLAEKETLLRELYHRTRNNMQVIRSMLRLHATYHAQIPIATFVQEIDQKILAMSMVHQKLYQAQDLSRVNLHEYLGELAHQLMQNYRISFNAVTIRMDEMQKVSVLIDTAIPCGLVLNELMSNALKYAFPEGRSGEIHLKLCQRDDGVIELYFADNGVGVPPEFDFHANQTLGLQTIFAIVERQLRGTIAFAAQNGVACTIRFQDNLYAPRV